MPRIVIVGSINMDLLVRCAHLPVPGETIIADSATEIPGGKGANQAVAAARAGGDVTMIGRVGDDAFASRLRDNLSRENVDTTNVRTSTKCASGVAIVAVEQSGENAIMVVPGANAHVSSEDIASCREMIQSADMLLLQLEIPLSAIATAIDLAKQAGVPIILDPAPMRADLPTELLHVDLVCPNQSEAGAILGREIATIEDAKASIGELHNRGAKNAIITMSGQGTVISDGNRIDWIPPFHVAAVDSTAAGDAFAGALAVRLSAGASLNEAARFASAAGAIAATSAGAQPAMPTRQEIEGMISPK